MKKILVDCPYCEGWGEIFDRSKVRYNSIDPPMRKCPVCGGSGQIPKEDLENIDIEKPPSYYEGDKSAYWDDRYDFMKDEGLI